MTIQLFCVIAHATKIKKETQKAEKTMTFTVKSFVGAGPSQNCLSLESIFLGFLMSLDSQQRYISIFDKFLNYQLHARVKVLNIFFLPEHLIGSCNRVYLV